MGFLLYEQMVDLILPVVKEIEGNAIALLLVFL